MRSRRVIQRKDVDWPVFATRNLAKRCGQHAPSQLDAAGREEAWEQANYAQILRAALSGGHFRKTNTPCVASFCGRSLSAAGSHHAEIEAVTWRSSQKMRRDVDMLCETTPGSGARGSLRPPFLPATERTR